jgi:hypothetical protein
MMLMTAEPIGRGCLGVHSYSSSSGAIKFCFNSVGLTLLASTLPHLMMHISNWHVHYLFQLFGDK